MVTIRAAVPDDETRLLALLPLLADFPVPEWRTARQVADADLEILLPALRTPGPETSIFVAEEPRGSIAGFIFSTTRQDYFTGKPHAHIEVLTVSDGARGKGVARSLIEATENWARSRGYSNVTLNVFARNTRASLVYDKLGYLQETVHYIKPLDLPATRGEDTR
jgi:ribosomal protein S18 acetylase RimI-like enzyme